MYQDDTKLKLPSEILSPLQSGLLLLLKLMKNSAANASAGLIENYFHSE